MFKYTYKNEECTDTTKNFMAKLGMDSETIESIKRQEVFEEKQSTDKKVDEAKGYLAKTDHKFYCGYTLKDGEDLTDIETKRNELREFIRASQ